MKPPISLGLELSTCLRAPHPSEIGLFIMMDQSAVTARAWPRLKRVHVLSIEKDAFALETAGFECKPITEIIENTPKSPKTP